MKNLFTTFLLSLACVSMWANSITYTASEKLTDATYGWETGVLQTEMFEPAIRSHTFDASTHTGTITFNGNLTTIGANAFRGCYTLTSITIPSTVTTIGGVAFGGCTGLMSIEVPSSVTTIGTDAFSSIINVVYTGTATGAPWSAMCVNGTVDGWLVYSDASKTHLAACSSAATGGVTLASSTRSIAANAFEGCGGLTTVILPDSLTTIGESAFFNCSGLLFINLPASLTTLGGSAFSGCSHLTNITFPASITSIADDMFMNCYGLQTVTFPESLTAIGDRAFFECTGLTSLFLPGSLTSLGANAFYKCTSLTSITCEATTPPSCNASFARVDKTIPLYVPEASESAYKAADGWKDFTNATAIIVHKTLDAFPHNQDHGSVEVTVTVTAVPQPGYRFDHWQDDNTDNPRTLTLDDSAILEAFFVVVDNPTSVAENPQRPATYSQSYDILGRPVDSSYKGIVIQNGQKRIQH